MSHVNTDADPTTATLILLGEWFAPVQPGFWLQELLDAAAHVGVNPRSVRTVVQRWAQHGWFDVERVGRRSIYRFTPKSIERIHRGEVRLSSSGVQPWDGRWRTLLFGDEHLSPAIKRQLTWHGYAELQRKVWLTPRQVGEPLSAELQRIPHRRFESTLPNGGDATLVSELWDLRETSAAYQRFNKRHAASGLGEAATGGGAFEAHFWLYYDYLSASRNDPFIPLTLLTEQWPGRQAAAILAERRAALSPASHRWIEALRRPEDST